MPAVSRTASLQTFSGRVYKPLPLQGNWVWMALNVVDPPRGHINSVEAGQARVYFERDPVFLCVRLCLLQQLTASI